MSMNIEVLVTIKDEEGKAIIETVAVEGKIPDFNEYKGPDNFREVFDKLERTSLEVRNESMKRAVENYLNELSKKKTDEKLSENVAVEIQKNNNEYTIDAEIGRLKVDRFRLKRGVFTSYDTGISLFPNIKPKEKYHTVCMDELMLLFPIDESYRNSGEKINRVLRRDDENSIKSRTLADIVVHEGETIQQYLKKKAEEIFKINDFDEKGKPIENRVVLTECDTMKIQEENDNAIKCQNIKDESNIIDVKKEASNIEISENKMIDNCNKTIRICKPVVISEEKVKEAIDNYNNGKPIEKQIDEERVFERFEENSNVISISADDVQVVKQKETERKKDSAPKENKEWAKNTIVHILCNKMVYVLNGKGIVETLIFLTAFMLNNGMIDVGNLVFYVDGARDLQNAIQNAYGWRPYTIILDWFHLEKKCKEFLSMIIKGKTVKATVLSTLLSLLWLGKVDKAIDYLKNLDRNVIKNEQKLRDLIGYFERNNNNIPCYALRKELGLKTSSNLVEKANDNIVANRQKHNGTSWSKSGSVALASVTAMFKNKEDNNWIKQRTLKFKFPVQSEVA